MKDIISILKSDVSLFSRLYISYQTRGGDLEDFFAHENNMHPQALSQHGKMRLGTKSDLLTNTTVLEEQTKTFQELDKVSLKDICDDKVDVPKEIKNELPEIIRCSSGIIFIRIWDRLAADFRKTENRALEIDEIMEHVWKPAYKEWKDLHQQLKKGEILFRKFDAICGRMDPDSLKKEFLILEDGKKSTWIKERIDQMTRYKNLQNCRKGASIIMEVVEEFELKGDFQPIQQIMRMLVLQELKVFVDLAYISTGDKGLEIAKVDVYSQQLLIRSIDFQLEPDCDYKDFLERSEEVWQALDSNANLPSELGEYWNRTSWDIPGNPDPKSIGPIGTFQDFSGLVNLKYPRVVLRSPRVSGLFRTSKPEISQDCPEKSQDDMNLSEEKKAPLRKKDIFQKRSMLGMHQSVKIVGPGNLDTPASFHAELRNPEVKGDKRLKLLESLRVSLTSNPVSWVQEFGVAGLNGILRNLTYCCDSKTERRSTYEAVRCLKAFMNNKFGLMQMIGHEEALTILSRTVDPSDPNTMLEAVRLLAAICIVPPDGHEKVLEGITVCGEIRGRDRFVPIIMGLGMRDNQPMQVANIQLVNAIVSTPDDLDFRLHLRNEIMRTGMIDLIGSLDTQQDEELQTHLRIFHDHKEEDLDEFVHRYDNAHIELEDPRQCFDLVYNSTKDTISEPYFLSILQHLLIVRDDAYARPQYYKLIEECITQIVLHKNGTDPDFRHTKRFDIDVEPLLSSLHEKSRVEDAEVSIVEISSKLETAITAKQESEAKAMTLEEKVKKYEDELTVMKEKIKLGIGAQIQSTGAAGGGGGPPPPPPPPPPGGGAIPPPPPPPPPPPGGGGGPPHHLLPHHSQGEEYHPSSPTIPRGRRAPPPPPGFMSPPAAPSTSLPYGIKKKKYQPPMQTKRLNWNQVQAKKLEKDSFWVQVREDQYEDESLFQGLIENFGVTKAKIMNTSETAEKKPTKKAKELKVLDPKAAQNLSILLGSIKVPYPEIKRRIVEVDEEKLSSSILESLIRYMPEPEQMKQLEKLQDQYNDLSEPEQFSVTMCGIKRVTPRLNSMLFKMQFPDMVQDIKPNLVSAIEACEEVKNSTKFSKLLELILLMGNFLNAGSRNAQSVGFEISFLPKLANTKAQDGKTTLVHFIANIVEQKYPELVGFLDEFTHLDKAARVSEETVTKNLKSMEKQLKQLETDIKNISKTNVDGDRFAEVMNISLY
ncbi:DIAPH2 [Mytilus edulis]|uniref:DIAPH2 n=1 Tax=Mytilus edulis TaxID=6550 RepID=A0A8S3TI76_MYTED|nr:DIAPH2 [Mytilus edulis]